MPHGRPRLWRHDQGLQSRAEGLQPLHAEENPRAGRHGGRLAGARGTVSIRRRLFPTRWPKQLANRVAARQLIQLLQWALHLGGGGVGAGWLTGFEIAGVWRAGRSLGWTGRGSSPISSRKMVPPCASWNLPWWSVRASVNAPFTWPKSSLSMRAGGMAAQLTRMNGALARVLRSCRRCATTSLPLPVSPVMSTVALVAAMRSSLSPNCFRAVLSPSNPGAAGAAPRAAPAVAGLPPPGRQRRAAALSRCGATGGDSGH